MNIGMILVGRTVVALGEQARDAEQDFDDDNSRAPLSSATSASSCGCGPGTGRRSGAVSSAAKNICGTCVAGSRCSRPRCRTGQSPARCCLEPSGQSRRAGRALALGYPPREPTAPRAAVAVVTTKMKASPSRRGCRWLCISGCLRVGEAERCARRETAGKLGPRRDAHIRAGDRTGGGEIERIRNPARKLAEVRVTVVRRARLSVSSALV